MQRSFQRGSGSGARRPLEPSRLPRLGACLCAIAAAWLFAATPAGAQDDGAPPAPPTHPEGAAAPPSAPSDDIYPADDDTTVGGNAPLTGAGGSGGAAADPDRAGSTKPGSVTGRSSPAKKRRGDINPCMTPDPGFGVYDTWSRESSVGQMIMPHKGGITKSGSFDVVIHFHGHEAIRKEFVKTADGIVLVGIDLGIGSGAYTNAFSAPYVFQHLLATIERAMAKKTGKKNAHIRKLGISSWSAGYGAVDQILRQPAGKRVDALVLLDSLHTGYADEQQRRLNALQIEPFIDFARRAAAGETFMFMSHSSIVPPGYASTTETANFIVQRLRGKLRDSSRKDVLGLDMIQRYDRGDFHVRGYTGDDKPDHCAHIGLMADILRIHLKPRWKTPKGRR